MFRRVAFLILLGVTWVLPTVAAAASEVGRSTVDPEWWDGFSAPTVDGPIHAMVLFRGTIVIGGDFTFAGDVRAHNVARWSSTGWAPLGEGVDDDVTCLFVHHDTLIVGGRFANAGGSPARGVARWDGSQWSRMGSGFSHPAQSAPPLDFTSWHDTLVAVGEFETSGSEVLHGAAWWDGAAWRPIGGGLTGQPATVAVFDDRLVVAGGFDRVAGSAVGSIAQWNGAAWSPLGEGLRSGIGLAAVRNLGVHAGELIAVGSFDSAGSGAARNIAAWNGTSWRPLGWGLLYPGQALLSRNGLLYTDGDWSTGYDLWNGTDWVHVPVSMYGMVHHFLDTSAGLFAAGDLTAYDSFTGAVIGLQVLRETSTGWRAATPWTERMHGLDVNSGVIAFAHHGGGIVAGGTFRFVADSPVWTQSDALALWKDGHWSAFPGFPGIYGPPRAIVARGDTIVVGGAFSDSHGGERLPAGVYRYDGVAWAALDTLPSEVTSLALHKGGLYAGTGGWSGPAREAGVYRWNGSAWSPVGRVEADGDIPAVLALLEFEGRLVVAGRFDRIAGVPALNVATWNGTQWTALGSTLLGAGPHLGAAHGLGLHEGGLYAAGEFGPQRRVLARWNGVEWEFVGPLRGIAWSVASAHGLLFVAGYLRGGSVPDESLYRWDGLVWHPMGFETARPVRALLVDDAHLYVGGGFTEAGGWSSRGIARWDGLGSLNVAPPGTLSFARPNPFTSEVLFTYRLASAGTVRVSVHDVVGRELVLLDSGTREVGLHSLRWDGRTEGGRRVPAGVYLIRLHLPGGASDTRKAVFLP